MAVYAVRCGECNTPATLGWNEDNKEFISMCDKCKTYTSLESLLESQEEDTKNQV